MASGLTLMIMAVSMMSSFESTTQAARDDRRPIKLVTQVQGERVLIRVIGDAATATRAEFELEVTSGGSGNATHTRQRGKADLQPGESAVLLSTTLGGNSKGRWRATLRVEPNSGSAYEEHAN